MLCRTLTLALLGVLILCSSGLALNQRQRSIERTVHKILDAPVGGGAAVHKPPVAPDDAPSSSDDLHGHFADIHKRIKTVMDQLADTRTSAQKAGQTGGHGLDAVEVEDEVPEPGSGSAGARKKAAHEDFHGIFERTKTMLENLKLGDLGKAGEGEGAHKDLFHGIDETMKKVFDANGGEFKDTLRKITENIDTEKLSRSFERTKTMLENLNPGDLGKAGEGAGAHKDLFHGIDETMKKVFDANGGEFKDTLNEITKNIDTKKLNESIRHFSKAAESIFRKPVKDAAKKRNEPEPSDALSFSVDPEGAQKTHGGEGIDDDSDSIFGGNLNFEEWFNTSGQDL